MAAFCSINFTFVVSTKIQQPLTHLLHTLLYTFATCTFPLKADTHEGFCSRSMLQAHFARVSTHEGAFSSSLNLPRELAPKYLTCWISWSILRGGNSAPEDKVYPWNLWYTRRSFAPGACPWSILQEQNPSCVSVLIHLVCLTKSAQALFLNFSWDDCDTQEKFKTKVIQLLILAWREGKLLQGVLWEMRKCRIAGKDLNSAFIVW